MKGVGAASIAGLVGGSSTTVAASHDGNGNHDDGDDDDEGDDDDDDHFAAVRVGNLVPDLVVGGGEGGPPSNGPGGGPPSTPPGRNRPHAPTSTAFDLYVGKPPDRNPTIGEVYYPTFGPGAGDSYLQVPAREYDIAVARSGTVESVIEDHVDVHAGSRYTALALGSAAAEDEDSSAPENSHPLQHLIIEDAESRENATPEEDWTEVSFVHASPNAGPVDIAVDGLGTLFEGVEFGAVSDYVSVPPDEYSVDILADGEPVLELTRELVRNTRLTVYVTGFAGVDEFPDAHGRFGLSAVATIDGLNPQPRTVLTR